MSYSFGENMDEFFTDKFIQACMKEIGIKNENGKVTVSEKCVPVKFPTLTDEQRKEKNEFDVEFRLKKLITNSYCLRDKDDKDDEDQDEVQKENAYY